MQVITIGIDLAKHVFQVHDVDANDKVVFNKPLRRSQVLPFFAKLAPCLIGREACASAHFWARELKKLGHDVRLMPAKDVKAYVKRNKNDSVDAAACSEAARRKRPTIGARLPIGFRGRPRRAPRRPPAAARGSAPVS
jgi:transposase